MRSRFNRRLDMKTRYTKARQRNKVYAAPGIHDCVIVLDGLKPDFNIGKIIRTADAFSVREVHLTGIEYFDPEPSKGSMRWVILHQHKDFASCYSSLQGKGLSFFCLEPGSGTVLGEYTFPQKSAFILGHEEFGLSFDPKDYSDIQPLTIPQWGKVQSLNVSIAASVAMYEYVRQHGASSAQSGAE